MQVVVRLRAQDLPSIPATFGPLMQRLIPRCWEKSPESRPSFQEIFSEFQAVDFCILPNVDRCAIKEAVGEVLTWEANPDLG
jgi:hypothetical protein